MTTPYQTIFDKFIKKLKGDLSFFDYSNLTDAEVEALVDDHLISLLERSVDKIFQHGIPDFDFYDKDDISQQFNESLVFQEIALLSDIMHFSYIEESRNKWNGLGMTFRSSELNVFSPANERDSVMKMIDTIENKVVHSIENYLSRDRLTWAYKSIYGGN